MSHRLIVYIFAALWLSLFAYLIYRYETTGSYSFSSIYDPTATDAPGAGNSLIANSAPRLKEGKLSLVRPSLPTLVDTHTSPPITAIPVNSNLAAQSQADEYIKKYVHRDAEAEGSASLAARNSVGDGPTYSIYESRPIPERKKPIPSQPIISLFEQKKHDDAGVDNKDQRHRKSDSKVLQNNIPLNNLQIGSKSDSISSESNGNIDIGTALYRNAIGDIIRSHHPIRKEFYDLVGRYIKYHNDATDNEKLISNISTPEAIRRQAEEERALYKWMVVKPGGQLCNRMRGVVTAFLLAILTDRVLVIEGFTYGDTKSFYELFKSPGFDIEFLIPGTIKRDGPTFRLDMDQKDLHDIVETWLCANFEDKFKNTKVLTLLGTNYVGSFFYKNPYFIKKLSELFVEDDLFRPILFWLFRPTDFVLELKNEFQSHIRRDIENHVLAEEQQLVKSGNGGAATSKFNDINARSFVTGYHIRSEYPISEKEWHAYANCEAMNIPLPFKNSIRNYRIVATDSPKSRENVLIYLGNNSLFYLHDEIEEKLSRFQEREKELKGLQTTSRRLIQLSNTIEDFNTNSSSNSNSYGMDNLLPQQERQAKPTPLASRRLRERLFTKSTKEGKPMELKFHKGKSILGMYAVLVDILLISESDQIFLTPFSSFSRIIGLYAKTPNVYMVSDYGVPEQDTHRHFTEILPLCYRYIRKEECVWMGWRRNYTELVKGSSCYSPYMLSDYC